MKKVYTAAFKAQVALDLLKEEKSLAQISAEYGVHPNVLRDWCTQALKGLTTIFDRRDDLAATKAAHAQQLEDLYAEIGRLTTQLTWLKKTVRAMAPYVPAIVSYTGSW
jgi:transposase-like protein